METSVDAPVESAPLRPARPLRLLVIDDDPLLLQSLHAILVEDGHQVVAADRAAVGIESFTSAHRDGEPFDLVITDLGMPYLDGRKVAAAIKAASPRTPVILLTGWGHRLLAESALPEGIDQVLAKPPRLAELRRALAELGGV
jgi:CheY-like chemotaxis protein